MAKSGFAKDRLRSFVERVERLEEEKKALSEDIKEVYVEAKGEGFDVKILRKVIALRKLDKADFQEMQAMLDLYLSALGMQESFAFDEIPQGSRAPNHGQSDETEEEASSFPAHDEVGKGPSGTTARAAPKPAAVASAAGPHPVKTVRDTELYASHKT